MRMMFCMLLEGSAVEIDDFPAKGTKPVRICTSLWFSLCSAVVMCCQGLCWGVFSRNTDIFALNHLPISPMNGMEMWKRVEQSQTMERSLFMLSQIICTKNLLMPCYSEVSPVKTRNCFIPMPLLVGGQMLQIYIVIG